MTIQAGLPSHPGQLFHTSLAGIGSQRLGHVFNDSGRFSDDAQGQFLLGDIDQNLGLDRLRIGVFPYAPAAAVAGTAELDMTMIFGLPKG